MGRLEPMDARFDVFTREEVHFLRDVITIYLADHADRLPSGDALGHLAGDEELGKRLIVEMHRSANWRSEATR
jgi:hypothetical protein